MGEKNYLTPERAPGNLAARVHWGTVAVLQVVMTVELVLVILQYQWLNAFLIATILAITLVPSVLRRRFHLNIPPEFQALAITFVFASLFLGEVRSYYDRFWWWDVALHASSGLLLGIFGFLLVYVLNEHERIDVHMRPRFVALFAFLFAVSAGAIWEIFEFGMDRILGTSMQKPMFGDFSGLTDTMWDLIVDALGALVISAVGWWYMKREKRSFIEAWIQKFVKHNPRFFRS